jgi:hypothetical protein
LFTAINNVLTKLFQDLKKKKKKKKKKKEKKRKEQKTNLSSRAKLFKLRSRIIESNSKYQNTNPGLKSDMYSVLSGSQRNFNQILFARFNCLLFGKKYSLSSFVSDIDLFYIISTFFSLDFLFIYFIESEITAENERD